MSQHKIVAPRVNPRSVLRGRPASPGMAVGPASHLEEAEWEVPRRSLTPGEVDRELARLEAALEKTRAELQAMRANIADTLGEEEARIFETHLSILDDQVALAQVVSKIQRDHLNAEAAYGDTLLEIIERVKGVKDAYLRERAGDLKDVSRRVLSHLLKRTADPLPQIAEGSILVLHELSPSLAVRLDRRHIGGFVSEVGGSSSHTAILARSLGLPGVVGVEGARLEIRPGDAVVVDGDAGEVIVHPGRGDVERAQGWVARDRARAARWIRVGEIPPVTQDGRPVQLMTNVEFLWEVDEGLRYGVEEIGLLRTEYLLFSQPGLPSEERQLEDYRAVVRRVAPHPVTIRTFDLGSDRRPPVLLPLAEANPALGLRGLRLAFAHPRLLRQQLRAILRAGAEGRVRILFPMVSSVEEVEEALGHVEAVRRELEAQGLAQAAEAECGVMVEVPAAALLAREFAARTRFLALGTNDLVQYTLAADRDNPRVGHLYQPYHPAVLRLLHQTVAGARAAGRPVIACGEMAADPWGAVLLIGLGVQHLSMSPGRIPQIRLLLPQILAGEAEALVRRALELPTPAAVKALLTEALGDLTEEEGSGHA